MGEKKVVGKGREGNTHLYSVKGIEVNYPECLIALGDALTNALAQGCSPGVRK